MKTFASLTVLTACVIPALGCGPPDEPTPTCSYVPILAVFNTFGGNSFCARDGPLSECAQDFGSLGNGGMIITISAANVSCVEMTIERVFLTDDTDAEFTLESEERSGLVAPLDELEIRLGFRASAEREFTGALVIESDAANTDGFVTIALTGAGG